MKASLVLALVLVSASAASAAPAVDDLNALLRDPTQTDRVRVRTAGLLGDLDDPRAESVLVQALADPNPAVRFGAARALGRPSRSAAVEPLMKLVAAPEERPIVRAAAARSLAGIADVRAIPLLMTTRHDEVPEVRLAARQALLTLPAAVTISRVDLLGEIVTDREAPEAARAEATRLLGQTGDRRALPVLVDALNAPDVAERLPATFKEFLQTRAAARASLPAAAARALADLHAKEAIPALVSRAGSAQGEARIAALEALARFRTAEAVAVATDGLGAREPRVRRWAAIILGDLEARPSAAALRSALADPDEGVRLQAAQALIKIGDVGSVDALVAAHDKETIPHVKAALADALIALAPITPW